MWWLYLPLIILGLALLLFGLLIFLGRFRNGALLRPVIARLSRIGFMRRFFTSISTKAIERQNPELASAIKKINPVASNPNPQAVQTCRAPRLHGSRSGARRRAGHREPQDAAPGRADAAAGTRRAARRRRRQQLAQAQAQVGTPEAASTLSLCRH
jgi:hypothetical protein